MTEFKLAAAALAGVLAVAGAGWGASEYLHGTFAPKEEVEVAANKADFVIDQQIASLISQISYLERKPNRTPGERDQLQYLRQQLETMKRVRSGK